jgi:hypothetical protein
MPSSCRAAKVSQGLAPDYYSPKTSKGSGLGTGYIKHYITDETREPHKLDSHQKALTRVLASMHAALPGISILTIFLNFMFGTRL